MTVLGRIKFRVRSGNEKLTVVETDVIFQNCYIFFTGLKIHIVNDLLFRILNESQHLHFLVILFGTNLLCYNHIFINS